MPDKLNIAIFASGNGSNFRAIQEAISGGKIRNAQIALVISNNSSAGALEIARGFKIPAVHISRAQYNSDDELNATLIGALAKHHINFIALAGYMKKIDASIVGAFRNRIVNIHPALLPKFGGSGMFGLHVHEAVLAAKENISGATVHIVDEEFDHGMIVLQKTVAVEPSDTAETLAARILKLEHEIYPEAIGLFAEGKIKIIDQKIIINNV
ncbi:MAG: phosphoribosylglycinamide formyltransferase [Ignavibacteriales bacterium]|nr:phosphoribosylglycinamide formyltransferase [Ignavibacteriales bacterium]